MELRQGADGSPGPADPRSAELAAEQERLRLRYARLDEVRAETERALRATFGSHGTGTRQAAVEREVRADELARRLSQLSGVERGLCFGRIDLAGADGEAGETYYIGRIGLRDADHEPLLVDWRAPAAAPFYTATPARPRGLVRRRHLHTRDRRVLGIDDEVFDLDGLAESDRRGLVGEGALLAALRRERTGRMGDVVATIQAEQDRVIRSELPGALVVQGGPGTGKTVAALHRAAYLLYTHRRVLARRGVLVVGPNTTFLRYIGQVLPSLGETDVVLCTLGELFPGVTATRDEPDPETARVKGDARMADLLRHAVRGRQRAPRRGITAHVDDMTLHVPGEVCRRARDRGRALRRPHNAAHRTVATELLTAFARDQARQLSRPLDDEDLRYARAALWQEESVRAALAEVWPLLTPQQLLTDLFADPGRLHRAARSAGLSREEERALLRPAGAEWTVADVPLLDEAAELLGEDDSAARAAARAAERLRRAEERYAQGVLEITGLAGRGFLDAATLAGRHRAPEAHLTTAERAAADRTWAYGHAIVDEAQELSAMAWRTVLRRVPTRSLTVVGDIAQTSSPAGARSWAQVLDPHLGGRWREERLTVNYRTPAEIMAVAADVLAEVAPDVAPPESVRDGGTPPRAVRVAEGALAAELPPVVAAESAAVGTGRLAVIAPAARLGELRRALPDAVFGAASDVLDSPVAVLTPVQAKGLEFDAVVVVDPAGIVAAAPQGGRDLYVAITRATRRLTVVHEGPLPPVLKRLAD
ncbi:MAG TPA: ATP-binding domain-containing protein [Thermobifida alba]|nr:ATP-binding domain-containing protein [Thermobifida alba]